MLKVIKNYLCGVFIGMANAAPGVSGGTVAVVLGVYEDLLALPSLDLKAIKLRFKEIGALILGMICGIFIFAKLMDFIYKNYPVYVNFFFIGVIFASLSFLFEKTKETAPLFQKESGGDKPVSSKISVRKTAIKMLWFIAGFAVMLYMFFEKKSGGADVSAAYETALTAALFFKLFAVTAAAAAAMIIPGVSGSFMLLILGFYRTVMHAAAEFNIKLLIPIALGAAVGLVAASRAVKYLLKRFPAVTYSFILGLVAGSVLNLMPQVCLAPAQRITAVCTALAGWVPVKLLTLKKQPGKVQL